MSLSPTPRSRRFTLLVTGNGALLMGGAVYANLPFDIANDFAPVSQLVTGSLMFVCSSRFADQDHS